MRNIDESSEAEQQTPTHLEDDTKEATEIQDCALMPGRVPWTEESISAIHTLFAKEIAAQDITMSCVKEKIEIQFFPRKIPSGFMTRSGWNRNLRPNLMTATKKQQIYHWTAASIECIKKKTIIKVVTHQT